MANGKDKQIAALKRTIVEQQETIREIVRHQARLTGRSVEEYLDALKSKEIVEVLSFLLERATSKLIKLQERRAKWRKWEERLFALMKQQDEHLAQLKEANTWIPLDEQLPETNQEVLAGNINTKEVYWGYYEQDEDSAERSVIHSGNGAFKYISKFTHWRAMPKPPKQENENV